MHNNAQFFSIFSEKNACRQTTTFENFLGIRNCLWRMDSCQRISTACFQSKDVLVLTFINFLDNILPLMLSIYSVVFKSNNLQMFIDAMMSALVVFFIYRRHHYDKAPLVFLSNVLYWKKTNHPLYEALETHLQIIDEYAVENFHSVLRAQTSISSTPEEISKKAREISATKGILRQFKTQFVPPKSATFSQNQLKLLKAKAAGFLLDVFSELHANPGAAKKLPRDARQSQKITRWILPNIFGDNKVDNRVLPLGFQEASTEPNPNK